MNKIKIGWSEVSILPEGRRVDLAGQLYERISGEVETPIAVTALAMECGEEQMIFIACDLVATSYKLLCAVRDYLPDDCGFDKEKLIISCIHTHSSFAYADRSDGFSSALKALTALMPEGAYEDIAFSDVHYGQNYQDAAGLYDYALPMAYSKAYEKDGADFAAAGGFTFKSESDDDDLVLDTAEMDEDPDAGLYAEDEY